MTGVTVQASVTMQLSIELVNWPAMPSFANASRAHIPFVWIEQVCKFLTDKLVNIFFKLSSPIHVDPIKYFQSRRNWTHSINSWSEHNQPFLDCGHSYAGSTCLAVWVLWALVVCSFTTVVRKVAQLILHKLKKRRRKIQRVTLIRNWTFGLKNLLNKCTTVNLQNVRQDKHALENIVINPTGIFNAITCHQLLPQSFKSYNQ